MSAWPRIYCKASDLSRILPYRSICCFRVFASLVTESLTLADASSMDFCEENHRPLLSERFFIISSFYSVINPKFISVFRFTYGISQDFLCSALKPVSYTHLDVYKRQRQSAESPIISISRVFIITRRSMRRRNIIFACFWKIIPASFCHSCFGIFTISGFKGKELKRFLRNPMIFVTAVNLSLIHI